MNSMFRTRHGGQPKDGKDSDKRDGYTEKKPVQSLDGRGVGASNSDKQGGTGGGGMAKIKYL